MKVETYTRTVNGQEVESVYALFENENEIEDFDIDEFASEHDAIAMEWDDGVASYYGAYACKIFHKEL